MSDEAEARRLEKLADAILKEDAKAQGFVKKVYGYGNYAKHYGILTPHAIATIRHHEFPNDFRTLHEEPDED